mgnify:CR=1 FL=1
MDLRDLPSLRRWCLAAAPVKVAIYGRGAHGVRWPMPVHLADPGAYPTAPGVWVFQVDHLLPQDRVGFDAILELIWRKPCPIPDSPTSSIPMFEIPTAAV